MGVHRHGGTMPGGLTPICDACGVSLCWDIAVEEYAEAAAFWDAWVCRDCNGGVPLSLAAWRASRTGASDPQGPSPSTGGGSDGTETKR